MRPIAATTTQPAAPGRHRMTRQEKFVVLASSLGTVFEWYDFYLVGALALHISKSFFAGLNPTAAFIFTLLSFAAGFAVRPFGALVFGRLGDLVGRKYTFLATIVIMGLATFLIGFIPGYVSIGIAAPVLFIAMRLLQGFALGGEYGGAVIYVAEHAPAEERGTWTAWIQTTAAGGLLLSLGIISLCRWYLGEQEFAAWGWRVPFLVSVILVGISVWMRLKLNESPAFLKMKEEGKTSKAPISEAFGNWKNLRIVLIALFGLIIGQAVVWYTGQFYSLFFLTQTLKVDESLANLMVGAATILSIPFYLVFAAISDRKGRKPVILAGFILGAIFFMPLYKQLTAYANPALEQAQLRAPITVVADPAECSLQFNPVGTSAFTSSCDIAKSALAKKGLNYSNVTAAPGAVAQIRIGSATIESFDGKAAEAAERKAVFSGAVDAALKDNHYPEKADRAQVNIGMTVLILVCLMLFGTMTYSPMAAMLVELFPTRIRYTAMSLPYHVGIGWVGGFLPASAFAIVAAQGNIYSGLWYPIVIATIAFVVGLLLVPETRGRDIFAD